MKTRQGFGSKSEPGRLAHLRGPSEAADLLSFISRELSTYEPKHLRWLIEFGAVYINKLRITNPDQMVSQNDIVRIHLDPKRYTLDKKFLQSRIVGESDDFLVANKPSGLPMHPTLDNLYENLISGFDRRLYVTHRLDVPTSGLVVIAKTPEYQTLFNNLVAARGLEKIYQGLTLKPVRLGEMRHFMKVTVRAPKEITPEEPPDRKGWDECLLDVLSCEPADFNAGVVTAPGFESKIKLRTGRTHQIRAQFSSVGAPLVGDEMYGGMKCGIFGLHACELRFVCPRSGRSYEFVNRRLWTS